MLQFGSHGITEVFRFAELWVGGRAALHNLLAVQARPQAAAGHPQRAHRRCSSGASTTSCVATRYPYLSVLKIIQDRFWDGR